MPHAGMGPPAGGSTETERPLRGATTLALRTHCGGIVSLISKRGEESASAVLQPYAGSRPKAGPGATIKLGSACPVLAGPHHVAVG